MGEISSMLLRYPGLLLVSLVIHLGFLPTQILGQAISPATITIARDSFGVPHIFAPTDAAASYGLAWAHAEDDFESIQKSFLAGKAMLGRVDGKDGILFDFAVQAFGIDSLVVRRYESDVSPDFQRILEGYAQGINDFAASHPKEILYKKAFPITPTDILKGYILSSSLMAGLGMALKAVHDDRLEEFYYANDGGSNAFAVAPERMEDGKAFLLSNSHQPNEGRFAWYEAHVQSEEGWDMIGGEFPGGVSLFTGTNRHLGWAHTNNYHNFGDIYALEINPKNKHEYKFEGNWKRFEERRLRLVIKLAGLRLPVSRKARWTDFGPVLKAKQGTFAFRFPGCMDIRSPEQWFRMNKAQNKSEFDAAIQLNALPLFNIVYGDDAGNILLHSGGRIPLRDTTLNWRQPLSGIDSTQIWTNVMPFDRLPHVENPTCGFVYNANNTPLHASGDSCNWEGSFPGLQRFEYNRGEVLGAKLKAHSGQFSAQDLLDIKFDASYADSGTYMQHFKAMYLLEESQYPEIADAIRKLKRWNLKGEVQNEDAALAMIVHDFLRIKFDCPFALLMIREAAITEADAVWAIKKARKYLLRHHGTLDVPLGNVQRLIRGEHSYPVDGLREVLRAADSKQAKHHKGQYAVSGGDCFIQITEFGPDGPEIKTINAFGASNHPESAHYADQMELFTQHGWKKMSFDKAMILQNAERVYHPSPNLAKDSR